MCICPRIQNNTICFKTRLLNAVNHFSLNIRLKIVNFYILIRFAEFSQIVFECNTTIYGRFTLAQQINIGAINNLYPHNTILLILIPLSREHYFRVQR